MSTGSCSSCGAGLQQGRFCSSCGAPVIESTDETDRAAASSARPTSIVPLSATGVRDGLTDRIRQLPALVLVAGGVAVLAVLVSVALLATATRTHTISGTMTVVDSYRWNADGAGEPCSLSGGYDDIAAGGQVVVRDESMTTLSTGSLSSGRRVLDACEFTFAVFEVGKAEFYEIRMGNDGRGGLQYSYDDMDSNGWTVALSLGS